MIRSLEEQMAPDDPDSVTEMLTETIPMKRYGTSEEVARLALFLASDGSFLNLAVCHALSFILCAEDYKPDF